MAFLYLEGREMENISRFCYYPHRVVDVGRHSCKTTEYKSTDSISPPSFKCNVLRESLSVDCQIIPCATLKRRWSWIVSLYIWLKLTGVGGILVPLHPPSILMLEVFIEPRRLKGLLRLLIYSLFCLAPADWAHEESHPSAATLGFVQNILVHPERSTAVP